MTDIFDGVFVTCSGIILLYTQWLCYTMRQFRYYMQLFCYYMRYFYYYISIIIVGSFEGICNGFIIIFGTVTTSV